MANMFHGVEMVFKSSPVYTIWGTSDYRYTFPSIRGLIWYNTPSHGGFRLGSKFQKMMQNVYGNVKHSSYEWLEEDCDWALFVYPFGKSVGFDEKYIQAALENLKEWNKESLDEYHRRVCEKI